MSIDINQSIGYALDFIGPFSFSGYLEYFTFTSEYYGVFNRDKMETIIHEILYNQLSLDAAFKHFYEYGGEHYDFKQIFTKYSHENDVNQSLLDYEEKLFHYRSALRARRNEISAISMRASEIFYLAEKTLPR